MSKIDELIQQYCPNGVEWKRIEEVATSIYRGSGITRDQVTKEGIPCVRYGEIYTTYGVWFEKCVSHTQSELIQSPKYFGHGDILFAITGESVEEIAKSAVYTGEERCLAGGDIVVVKHKQNPKYMGYVLSTAEAQTQKSKGKVKSKVVHASVSAIQQLSIPVPPLPVQEEIVRILDKFTQLEAELEAELEARRKQYEFYRDKLLNCNNIGTDIARGYKLMSLGEIGRVCMCKRIMKNETNSIGEIPFFKIGTFGKTPDAFISAELFEEYKKKYSYPTRGAILLSASGTIGRAVVFDGKDAYFQDSNIIWLENDETVVTNRYLFYAYQIVCWKTEGGTIPRLYNDNFLKIQISVPSLAEQERIVTILDKFDTLVNDISTGLPAEINARRQQYEYYRDKLLTFGKIA